jgi:hypothetical protein
MQQGDRNACACCAVYGASAVLLMAYISKISEIFVLLSNSTYLLCWLQEDEELEAEMGLALESSTLKHPLEQALQLLEKHDAAAAAKLLEQHTGASSSGGTGKQQHTQQGCELAGHAEDEQQQQPDQQAVPNVEGEQPASTLTSAGSAETQQLEDPR